MIEAYVASGQPASTMRQLTALADRLGVRTPAMLAYLKTPAGPAVVPSPCADTPAVTLFTSPTPPRRPLPSRSHPRSPSLYQVVEQRIVCEGTREQLRVWVRAWPPPSAEPPTPAGSNADPGGPPARSRCGPLAPLGGRR